MRVSHSGRMRVGSFAQASLLGEEEEQPRAEGPCAARTAGIMWASKQPLLALGQKAEFSSAQGPQALSRK